MTRTAPGTIGPHPFMGNDEVSDCDLDGCAMPLMHDIHSSAPEGSRVLEAAKAIDRLADDGLIVGVSTNTRGRTALSLLSVALIRAGHPSREERTSERVMRESSKDRHGPGKLRYRVKTLAMEIAVAERDGNLGVAQAQRRALKRLVKSDSNVAYHVMEAADELATTALKVET